MEGDPVVLLFREASQCGDDTLRSEEEWEFFRAAMVDQAVVSDVECEALDRCWADSVARAKWQHGRGGQPKLTFRDLRGRLLREFGGLLPGSTEHESNLRQLQGETEQLSQLVGSWKVSALDETQTSRLLALLHSLEALYDQVNSQTRCVADRQAELMDAEQLRALVHVRLADGAAPVHPCNPAVWQKWNQPLIEAQLLRQRVSLMHSSQRKPLADRFGLGCGFGCFRALGKLYSSKEKTDVDLVVVELPKDGSARATRFGDRVWRCFDAHRQLALGRCLPHVFGIDDTANDATRFYYAFTPSRSLAHLCGIARRKHAVLGEQSPLFRHWLTEIVRGLFDLHRMCTYECVTKKCLLTMDNVFVGDEGATVRFGQLRWGPRIDGAQAPVAVALAGRDAALLASFAEIVDGMLLKAHRETRTADWDAASDRCEGSSVRRTFSQTEAHAGVYVLPGEQFEIVLEASARREDRWHFPEVVEARPGHRDPTSTVSFAGGEPWRTIPNDPSGSTCRVTLTAHRPGRCILNFACFSSNRGRPEQPSMAVPVTILPERPSPTLRAILRCCRTGGLSIASLATHEYLRMPVSLGDVMNEYRTVFARDDPALSAAPRCALSAA